MQVEDGVLCLHAEPDLESALALRGSLAKKVDPSWSTLLPEEIVLEIRLPCLIFNEFSLKLVEARETRSNRSASAVASSRLAGLETISS